MILKLQFKVPPTSCPAFFPTFPQKKLGGKCRKLAGNVGKCRDMSGNVGKSENVEISYNERGQRFHLPRRIDIESHCQNCMFMIII